MVLSAYPALSSAPSIRPTLRSTKRHVGEVLGPQAAPSGFGGQIVYVAALRTERIQVAAHVVIGPRPG